MKLYSPNEVAEVLSFSRRTVYRWIHDGDLRAVRFGRAVRIRHDDLEEFQERGLQAEEHLNDIKRSRPRRAAGGKYVWQQAR